MKYLPITIFLLALPALSQAKLVLREYRVVCVANAEEAFECREVGKIGSTDDLKLAFPEDNVLKGKDIEDVQDFVQDRLKILKKKHKIK